MTTRTLAPVRQVEAFAGAIKLTAGSPFNSSDIDTKGRKGAIIVLSITLDPDTVSIVVKVQGKDMNGLYYDIPGLDTGAQASVTTKVLSCYPGLVETAGEALGSVILPEIIRVVSTHTNGTTMTYGVTVEFKE